MGSESNYVIADLVSQPHFLPEIADAFEAEWPDWCKSVGRAHLESIFRSGPPDELPVVLVAFDGATLLGTIALRPWFAEEWMSESPWVRQLLVLPAYRGRGIDRLLGAAVEERAATMGFEHLYAATNRIEPLLARRGWEVFARIEHDGAPMAWLKKKIN